MTKKRLIWFVFPTYLVVIVAALVAVGVHTTRSVGQFYDRRIATDLQTRAALVQEDLLEQLAVGTPHDVDAWCHAVAPKAGARVTVILRDGQVIGDSGDSPEHMDNHATRPEMAAALAGEVGESSRFSHTLGERMTYVAVPLRKHDEILGALRLAVPTTEIQHALWSVYKDIAWGGLVVVLLAGAVSYAVSRRIARPLEEMREGAVKFANGDLSHRLTVPAWHEMAVLAETMNQIAAQLDDRMRAVVRQRNQQEAILSSMVEGVLAVDTDECIISLNQAAARLLDVKVEKVQGCKLRDVVQYESLLQFVSDALEGNGPVEGELVFPGKEEHVFQVHGTVLRDAQGKSVGAMLVLNDVTRLQRLERVRRDFVANVSHELRTPITSIKGFVETLLDGAMHSQEDAFRFLGIVSKHADRLNAILEDLLILSRIEEGEETAEIRIERSLVKDALRAAVQLCRVKGNEHGVAIELSCPDALQADINAPLVEQAVSNLVDNAVKYSEPGSTVHVNALRENGELIIRVEDHGCGIPQEHLPRLFERFYRVDKARSRRLGGTGLGLAIVKHIAQAHGGRVGVDSTPGEGSTFAIHLPS